MFGKYCVYITHYYGNKLPGNYIGSTSTYKINNGYRGSVTSKKYKHIWKSEQRNNPNLFHTEVISYHDTRPEATYKELCLQKLFNVVSNELFINMSYAAPNGYFGRDVSGKDHPMYGKRGELSPNYGKKDSPEVRNKKSKSNTGKVRSEESKRKQSISNLGKIGPKSHNFGLRRSDLVKMNKSIQEEKLYRIIDPFGEEFIVRGMKKFCIENNLNYSSMYQVASGNIAHHRNWKCFRLF